MWCLASPIPTDSFLGAVALAVHGCSENSVVLHKEWVYIPTSVLYTKCGMSFYKLLLLTIVC